MASPTSDDSSTASISNAIVRERFYPFVASCDIVRFDFLLEFYLGEKRDGVFVDVGAYDGVTYSNTYGLALAGWRGLCVEPDPDNAALCRQAHEGHDVQVLELAVGAPGVTTVTFERGGPLTTAHPALADESRTRPWALGRLAGQHFDCPATSLPVLLATHGIALDFDVLSVDVEGGVDDVFHDFEHWTYRPKMIAVELFDLNPQLKTLRRIDYLVRLRIERAGYLLVYKDPMNTVFVRDDIAAAAHGRW